MIRLDLWTWPSPAVVNVGPKARVALAMRGSGDNHIVLQQKIPVYISYFTLRVNDDGSISTFGDLYGHDAKMVAALNRKNGGVDAPNKENKVAANQVKGGNNAYAIAP
jgi:hypothetical protein